MLISYIKGLLASSWLGKLMPLINIPSKSARRGTREPELRSVKGRRAGGGREGGGGEGRRAARKLEKHYRDNFVTAFLPRSSTAGKNRGEFCILRLCSTPRGSSASTLPRGRIVDRDERSSHSNFCILSLSLQSGPYV